MRLKKYMLRNIVKLLRKGEFTPMFPLVLRKYAGSYVHYAHLYTSNGKIVLEKARHYEPKIGSAAYSTSPYYTSAISLRERNDKIIESLWNALKGYNIDFSYYSEYAKYYNDIVVRRR